MKGFNEKANFLPFFVMAAKQMKGYKLVQAKILRHMECEGDFVNFQVVGGSPPVPLSLKYLINPYL